MPEVVVDELVALASRLALDAGRLLIDGLGRVRTEVGTKSSATDMVTEMDRASETLIVDGLRAARPHDALLGEEGAAINGTSGVEWVIDPLDGTTNYLYRLPAFSVSIAARVDGVTVAGVVHDPLHLETFTATARGGAYCNGEPIRASAVVDIGQALVETGYGYQPALRASQGEVTAHVLPRVRDVRRFGSAALDLCWVACGRVDAYFERGLQPWDRAAGALIASEAGAFVDAAGDLVVAAATGIAPAFVALLAEAHA